MKFLKVVCSNMDFLDAVTLLGESEVMSLSIIEVLESMVCSLYRARQEIEINEARYKLFTKPSNHYYLSPSHQRKTHYIFIFKQLATNSFCGNDPLIVISLCQIPLIMFGLQKKMNHLQYSGQLIDLRQNQCLSLCRVPVPKHKVRLISAAALQLTCHVQTCACGIRS